MGQTTTARPPARRETWGDVDDARAWEAAYRRFQTPEDEVRKFRRRLRWLGAASWPRDARVGELFCGRGNALVALERLGFRDLEGIDRSRDLLAAYRGPAVCTVADCRALPCPDGSKDVIIVNGGLHHLPRLPEDLDLVLRETRRVLAPNGRLALVEPWTTPFLAVVHAACRSRRLRRGWPRLDALATMIEHERTTYEAWLAQPQTILATLERHFVTVRRRITAGKLLFVGVRREGAARVAAPRRS